MMEGQTTELTPLEKARLRRAELKAKGELEILDPIEKAYRNPHSKKAAIRAMCYECVGRGSDSNWRKEVGNCTAWHCALWPLRPYQHLAPADHGLEKRAEAVKRLPPGPIATAAVKLQPALVIKAKCLQCSGSRATIADCPSRLTAEPRNKSGYRGCPIWPLRPYQSRATETPDDDEISSRI